MCQAWQLGKKAIALKNHAAAIRLKSLSEEYLQLALNGLPESTIDVIKKLLIALNGNVRSSSPLEAINSIIRQSLNSCRGQISQETLNLLAFHINHTQATRGKYAGTSAYERLTGNQCNASSINLLLANGQQNSGHTPKIQPCSYEHGSRHGENRGGNAWRYSVALVMMVTGNALPQNGYVSDVGGRPPSRQQWILALEFCRQGMVISPYLLIKL